jgi:hypothetical protein
MAAKENQNAALYAGDVRALRFPISDKTGGPSALTAPEGTWRLGAGPKTDTDVEALVVKTVRFETETINALSWTVAYVDLIESDTKDLVGAFVHQLRILDGAAKQVSAAGVLTIKRRLGLLI